MEEEPHAVGSHGNPNPTRRLARMAAEEPSRDKLGKEQREGKQSERACSYPLLTPELCIPELLVLSPFAMGEADTEE